MLDIIDHNSIRELRLARPPVNALNPALVAELTTAIQHAPADAKGLVISGREGLFSAGLDVPELLQLDRAGMTHFWARFFALLEAVARSPVPIVAAITGHSPAGGAVLSIFCDYRLMSRGDYVIGLNETRVGLLVPEIILNALIRLTGAHRAERMVVAGALISPEQALAAGMVDALSDNPASTVADAIEWCRDLTALPAHAMLGNRQLMRRDIHRQFDALTDSDVSAFVEGWFDDDAQKTLFELVARLKSKS